MPEGKTKLRVKIRSGRGAQSTTHERSQAQPTRVPRLPLGLFPRQALLLGVSSMVVVIGAVTWLFFSARTHEAGLSQAPDTRPSGSSAELKPAWQERYPQPARRSPSPTIGSELVDHDPASTASVPHSPFQAATPASPSSTSEMDTDPQQARQIGAPSEKDTQEPRLSVAKSHSKYIIRAQFTNGIKAREPIDRIGPVVHPDGGHVRRLYFFTELKGLKGEKVTHRWEHEGDTMAKVSFPVRNNRWRVYSSKHLTAAMTGAWRVVVVNSAGEPLQVSHFTYAPEKTNTAATD